MKNYKALFIILSLLFFSCKTETNTLIFHKSHEPKKQNAPFSDVVETNDFLFLSGQIGMDHSSRTLVSGGIEKETTQTIENIKAVLERHNSSLNKVVKCTVVLSNIDDFQAFNAIYKNYFKNKPARTTFAASGLARDAKIEIECIAAK